ncbi:MAG: tyrosine--tRNA ligase [Pelagibacterales bacterium]|nr:tyrosine--tRNA ligase [Pelagibacterales bacterium]
MNFKSKFLQEFQARGFFAACTHPQELDEILNKESITAYIGFDCTAKSLHAGSLIQIMILRMLQKHGHKPLILLGGGTTKIGDPSGKDEARKVLSENDISNNLNGIRKTLEKFISFEGENAAEMVNNNDWLKNLNYLEFLRDIGRHFSINRMLTFDSVKLRLEREQPLSFLEFNYMILQAYDFYYLSNFFLNKKYTCILQIGGSDQWGNIVNGVELARRKYSETTNIAEDGAETSGPDLKEPIIPTFGLTSPLLTTSDGKKMGKTSDGAVWLDSEMLPAFDYFQYFRNIHDADVGKFLKLFTDLSLDEIEVLVPGSSCLGGSSERVSGVMEVHQINKAKEILAFEATKICHGEKAASDSLQKAREIFVAKNSAAFEEKEVFLGDEKSKKLVDIIFEINAAESKGAAKKLIEGKAVKINGEAILDIHHTISNFGEFELSVGKKKFFKILVK